MGKEKQRFSCLPVFYCPQREQREKFINKFLSSLNSTFIFKMAPNGSIWCKLFSFGESGRAKKKTYPGGTLVLLKSLFTVQDLHVTSNQMTGKLVVRTESKLTILFKL